MHNACWGEKSWAGIPVWCVLPGLAHSKASGACLVASLALSLGLEAAAWKAGGYGVEVHFRTRREFQLGSLVVLAD